MWAECQTVQEKLLVLLPLWNYNIAKPCKRELDDGVSMEMYYCIIMLQWAGGSATMSQIAAWSKATKQQTTNLVSKLVEQGFAERHDVPGDRRLIKIQLTDKATDFTKRFIATGTECFQPLLQQMDEQDTRDFETCLDTLFRIFRNLPSSLSCIDEGRRAKFDVFEED